MYDSLKLLLDINRSRMIYYNVKLSSCPSVVIFTLILENVCFASEHTIISNVYSEIFVFESIYLF